MRSLREQVRIVFSKGTTMRSAEEANMAKALAIGLCMLLLPGSVFAAGAQADGSVPGMFGQDMPAQGTQKMPGMDPSPPAQNEMSQPSAAMPGMNMGGQEDSMAGALGDYSTMRDSSGTSWQPDSTPMEAITGELDSWSTMVHGWANLVYDHQGGQRGADKTFSESMLMGMAQHALGDGRLTLHGMISLDPLMGKSGYPLLLQAGETANGASPLIDRQHPHNLFQVDS